MRIPSREEFAPIPEAVARFGTPDPLEVLPALENQLEAVEGSNAQLRKVAAGLREVADDMEVAMHAVIWRGDAADQFQSRVNPILKWIRSLGDDADEFPIKVSDISEKTKDAIRRILNTIAGVAAIVGAILGFLGLKRAALVVFIIAGLATIIAANLNDILLLIDEGFETWRHNHPIDKPLII